MNKNMSQAKKSLKAELEHAVQGAEFWASKADSLREMIAKLDNFENEPVSPAKANKPRAKETKDRLPRTNRDFWLAQFSAEQRTSAQILDGALLALNITPSTAAAKKIANRLATSIQQLTKDGSVIAHGEGRRRKFTKAKGV